MSALQPLGTDDRPAVSLPLRRLECTRRILRRRPGLLPGGGSQRRSAGSDRRRPEQRDPPRRPQPRRDEHDLSLRVRAHHRLPAEHTGTGSGIRLERRPGSGLVSNLQPGKMYHFRLVATNELGTTFSPDRTFKTASKPQVGGVLANELSATGATLNARINPENSPRPTTSSTARPPPMAPAPPRPTCRLGRTTPNTWCRFRSPTCSRGSPTTSR